MPRFHPKQLIIAGLLYLILSAPIKYCSTTWGTLLAYLFIAWNAFVSFLLIRHEQLKEARRTTTWPSREDASQDYYLFVLGSGGHTKEMLMMMDDGFCNFEGLHRRYLVSSGDSMSVNHVKEHEEGIERLCKERGCQAGSYDVKIVTRARAVHQSLLTTPITALKSIIDIFPALIEAPKGKQQQQPAHPQRIFSNGPATGLIVLLAVHALKIFWRVPAEVMNVVYIESWARITTLSLTGKLVLALDLADVFGVQHEEVAKAYKVRNVGEMVFNAKRGDT